MVENTLYQLVSRVGIILQDCMIMHMGLALMNPRQSIGASLIKQSKQQNIEYRIRVNTSLVVAKHLLRCGMPFRGHDESHDSTYKGIFLETIAMLKESNEDIAKVLKCATGNNHMTSHLIQKELAAACAYEVTKNIVLGITSDLNLALQKCDQDILNSLDLVNATKINLQEVRDDGWEELLLKVVSTCNAHNLDVPDMDAPYIQGKKARGKASSVSNRHHYKNDCLVSIIDLQLQELNARFNEENTKLLRCVACLSPALAFKAFDIDKLVRMVELYPDDFVDVHEVIVRNQLKNYIFDVRSNSSFLELKGISDLCRTLVDTNKCNTYWVVYKLVKLALLLPVATASVERVFSAMKYVKSESELCNKMGDQWLNDRLVTFIERDVLHTISNDVILDYFQQMHSRRFTL